MLVSEAITGINYALRGTDDDAPAWGSDASTYWLSVLNRKKDEFYRDATRNWSGIYSVESVGTISASTTPSYSLDESFIAPCGDGESSGIYVIKTSKRHDFTLIKPNERNTSNQEVFIAGLNPKTLYFSNEIKSTDTIVGGTLYVAGYYMPDNLTAAADELPFSDPQWAVLASAAEIAENDIVYEDKAGNLNAKANNLYAQMVAIEQRGTNGEPRKSKYKSLDIRGY